MANPANPNYLVTPDTKIQVLPSTDDINQGSNLTFEGDSGQFSFYSNTVIHTSIDQTFQAVEAPTRVNISKVGSENIVLDYTDGSKKTFSIFHKYRGEVEFEFNLRGTTRMRNIFFTFISDMLGIVLPNLVQAGDNEKDAANNQIRQVGRALVSPPGQEKIYNIPQPELANLDVIRRMDVWLGSNQMTFENENMLEVKDRKIHASSLNLDRNEQIFTAPLGTRNAVLKLKKENAKSNLTYYGGGPDNTPKGALDPSWVKTISTDNVSTPEEMYEKHYSQDLRYLNSTYVANKPTINYLYNQPTSRNYIMPLWLMIPFFNQYNACLPSQMPIKLRFEFEWTQWYDEKEKNPDNFLLNAMTNYTISTTNDWREGVPEIPKTPTLTPLGYQAALKRIQNRANSMMGDSSSSFYLPGQAFNKISSGCQIMYEYFMLSEEINKNVNAAWNVNPLTYNYLSWKKFPFEAIRVYESSVVMENIIQNWNMPLQIFIRLNYMGPQNIDSYVSDIQTLIDLDYKNYTSNQYPGMGNQTEMMVDSLGVAKTPTVYNFKSGSAGGFAISMLKIYKGGTCVQDIRNMTNQSTTGYEIMQQSYNTFLNKPYQDLGHQLFSNINLNQVANGYKITMVPSRQFEIGSYPLDQGPVVLRFEITFKEPIKPGYTLAVYSCQPEQMILDRTYKATTFKWPALLARVTNSKVISLNQN